MPPRTRTSPYWAGAVAAALLALFAVGCAEPRDEPSSASIEADTLKARAGNVSTEEDPAASGDKALRIFGDDTAERAAELPESRFLLVRARGDQCNGSPRLRVTVDGKRVLDEPVDSPDWADYRARVEIEAGEHEVAIAPMGDLAEEGCDRTLVVDTLQFSAEEIRTRVAGGERRLRYDRQVASRRSRRVFEADFADGLSEYPHKVNRDRIDVVEDPELGARRKVLEFKVFQDDTGPTDNPRAQLETPFDFEKGDDRFFGYALYFPDDFPTQLPDEAWVTVGEQAYGPPFDGAAGTSLRVQNVIGGDGAELRWQRNETYGFDIPWRGPRIADVKGRWVDIVQRIRLDDDPASGFVELWLNTGNGWIKQQLAGQDRLYMSTYDKASDDGPNNSRLSLYYRKDIQGPLTILHGAHRIATAGVGAFEAVDPGSYRR